MTWDGETNLQIIVRWAQSKHILAIRKVRGSAGRYAISAAVLFGHRVTSSRTAGTQSGDRRCHDDGSWWMRGRVAAGRLTGAWRCPGDAGDSPG